MSLTAETYVLADDEQLDALWESCQEVLRRNRFRLDRVDRRAGVISTYPVTSQQFFEFWRQDVATFHDLMAASVNAIRRRVTVQVDREESGAGAYRVSVVVAKEQLSARERQFNNSAAALRVFDNELPGEAGERVLTRSSDCWVALGRDGAMERRLLRQIAQRGGIVGTTIEPAE